MKQSLFAVLTFTLMAAMFSCTKDKGGDTILLPDDTPWPSENLRTVKADLSYPWEILWGKDNNIWLTEKMGKVLRIDPKTGYTSFKGVIPDVVINGEGGLLGMVHHPDFLNNGLLYVAYNYNKNGRYTQKLVRFRATATDLTEPLVLIDKIPAASIHNGSRLLITSDNKLLMTTGDAAIPASAQDMTSLAGKILRINLDGSIPSDNPISNSPVWTSGHRNAQGLAAVNGRIFVSEHGPNVEDEVNIAEQGRNYGWPSVNGPCEGTEQAFCTEKNVVAPIWSTGNSTLAVSGMDYYNGDRISRWKNSILLATLKDATLYQLKLNNLGTAVESSTPFYRGQFGRLRDVCVSPEGRVYICTSNGEGLDKIIEVQQ